MLSLFFQVRLCSNLVFRCVIIGFMYLMCFLFHQLQDKFPLGNTKLLHKVEAEIINRKQKTWIRLDS